MSLPQTHRRLDEALKLFGAASIAIAVALTVGVLALTIPFDAFLNVSPAAYGSIVFTVLLVAVGYTMFSLRRGA